jgi:hypothetical protein
MREERVEVTVEADVRANAVWIAERLCLKDTDVAAGLTGLRTWPFKNGDRVRVTVSLVPGDPVGEATR